MRIQLSSDEVNLLVQRYLLENGFTHSAFAFQVEASIAKNPFWISHGDKIPPNALVTFLQKAMLFVYIEYHTDDQTGDAIPCDEPFSFFRRHECWHRADGEEPDESVTPKGGGTSTCVGSGGNGASAPTASGAGTATASSASSNISNHASQNNHVNTYTGATTVDSATAETSEANATNLAAARRSSAASSDGFPCQLNLSENEADAAAPSSNVGVDDTSVDDSFTSIRSRRGGYRQHRGRKRVRLGSRSAVASSPTAAGADSLGTDGEETLVELAEAEMITEAIDTATINSSTTASFTTAAAAVSTGSFSVAQTTGATAQHGRNTSNALISTSTATAAAPVTANVATRGGKDGRNVVKEENGNSESSGCIGRSTTPHAVDEGTSLNATGVTTDVPSLAPTETAGATAPIFVGPPMHALVDRVRLKNYACLIEKSDVGDAGALSEWNPIDPELIVTNFAVGSPRLYRVPRVLSGCSFLYPFRELCGPVIASGVTNPGSSAHWKNDGSLLATGYESGGVQVWTNEGDLVTSLRTSDTSVICTAFSHSGSFLAAACADGKVFVWRVVRTSDAKKEGSAAKLGARTPEYGADTRNVSDCVSKNKGDNTNHSHSGSRGTSGCRENRCKANNDKYERSDESYKTGNKGNCLHKNDHESSGKGDGGGCSNKSSGTDGVDTVGTTRTWEFSQAFMYQHTGGVIDLDWSCNDVLASGSVDGMVAIRSIDEEWVARDEGQKKLSGQSSPSSPESTTTVSNITITASREADGSIKNPEGTSTATVADEAPASTSAATTAGSSDVASAASLSSAVSLSTTSTAAASSSSKVTSSTLSSSTCAVSVAGDSEIASLRWDASGRYLAIVDSTSTVRLWRSDCPNKITQVTGHREPLIRAEWRNPTKDDSRTLLVTAAMDHTVILRDVENLDEPLEKLQYNHPPTSLRVSNDGSMLAVGTYDSAVHVYTMPKLQLTISLLDPHMVIPHISWRCTNDCLAYNVFQLGKTVVFDTPKPGRTS